MLFTDLQTNLKQFVETESIYPKEERLADNLYSFFKKKQLRCYKEPIGKNRYNIIVEKGSGPKSILLYSHLDTVGIVEGWKTDPLKLHVVDDKAFGLGAWDMKGGMAAEIAAFLQSNPKHYALKMVFCSDEEYISKGGYAFINSPFIQNVACVISCEPAFYHGLQGIVTGRIGRAVYDIHFVGQSTHYAFYKQNIDPNLVAAQFIQHITQLNKTINDEKKQFIFARKIDSQTIGMSIPQRTIVQLDSAILPPNTHKKMLEQLKKIASTLNKTYPSIRIDVSFVKRETPFLEPYEINADNIYLTRLKESVRKTTGKSPKPYFRSSVSDENLFGFSGIPTFGIGPIGGNAHAPNEWVSLSSLGALSTILTDFFSQIDEGEI